MDQNKLPIAERQLAPNETLTLRDHEPLPNPEAMQKYGAAILATVEAGPQRFDILDLRKLPTDKEGYRKLGNSAFNADYLIVDDDFGVKKGKGFKGVRIGEGLTEIGRDHQTDRFDYGGGVSREHFALAADESGLSIINHNPKNRTKVTYGPERTRHKTTEEHLADSMGYWSPEMQALYEKPPIFREVGEAEMPLRGEDAKLIMPEKAVFGVFDGAGGEQGGAKAANIAAESIQSMVQNYSIELPGHLAWGLNQVSEQIANDPEAGITTAVVGKIIERGENKALVWASVGDSRIYLVRADNSVEQITQDEGEGRYIYNALGTTNNPASPIGTTKQCGELPLLSGDHIIMCSDGITGDAEEELMSNDEIAEIMRSTSSAEQAAKLLTERARKQDDRTVIVIAV